jgi:hypothetical protein
MGSLSGSGIASLPVTRAECSVPAAIWATCSPSIEGTFSKFDIEDDSAHQEDDIRQRERCKCSMVARWNKHEPNLRRKTVPQVKWI